MRALHRLASALRPLDTSEIDAELDKLAQQNRKAEVRARALSIDVSCPGKAEAVARFTKGIVDGLPGILRLSFGNVANNDRSGRELMGILKTID